MSCIISRFIASEKYVALHIYDDEDVEIMINDFDQHNDIAVLEMYVKVDGLGCSTIPSQFNEVSSCMLQTIVDSNEDDGDYVVSNSFVEETSVEEHVANMDSFDTNDEAISIEPSELIQPLSIYELQEDTFAIKFDKKIKQVNKNSID